MVGNDVVDLLDPDARGETLHPRFDERVFCERELHMLGRSTHSGRLRWRMWAAKEAAYKAARKLDGSVIFSPRRFETRGLELAVMAPATVEHAGRSFALRVVEQADAVHAVAFSAGERASCCEVQRLDGECALRDPDGPSRAVRRLALMAARALLQAPEQELEIRREGRIPRVYRCGAPAPLDLSLSHHGAVVAFVLVATSEQRQVDAA